MMLVFMIDSVAGRVTRKEVQTTDPREAVRAALADDERAAQTRGEAQQVDFGGCVVRFVDQDGTGHYLGACAGSVEEYARVMARRFLGVLCGHGEMR